MPLEGVAVTATDWIALLGIALPLCAKVAVDVAVYLAANRHAALANIVGMAGREAATIGRTLASLPANSTAKDTERALIAASTEAVMTRMGDSASTVGADSLKVSGIIQGELDKLLTAPIAVVGVSAPGASPQRAV